MARNDQPNGDVLRLYINARLAEDDQQRSKSRLFDECRITRFQNFQRRFVVACVFNADADETGVFLFEHLRDVRVRTRVELRGALLTPLRISPANANKFGAGVGVKRPCMFPSSLARSYNTDSDASNFCSIVAVKLFRQVVSRTDFHHAEDELPNCARVVARL